MMTIKECWSLQINGDEMNNVKIGVIGAAGVAATNKLCELIEEKMTLQGAYRDCHHPEMIVWQATQVPSRSMYLEGKGESFIPGYIEIAKKLEECGATKICMCCNTAHYAIEEIRKSISVPMIDMIEATVYKVRECSKKRVGIMASDGCVKYKIYDKYINAICPDVTVVYPDSYHQKLVTKGICNIKNSNRFLEIDAEERPNHIFSQVKEYLLYQERVDIVVSGCTDIRVDFINKDGIDSLEVLRDEIINCY